VHVSAVVVDPPEQTQLDSTAQVALQPSPCLTFPSSQPSVLATSSPSPHIVTQYSGFDALSWYQPAVHSYQTSAAVVDPPRQTQLDSTVQVEEHPSPLPVSLSSQLSLAVSNPLPHTSAHVGRPLTVTTSHPKGQLIVILLGPAM
jgi:hypothetical protein